MVRTYEQVQETLNQMREDGVPDEDLVLDDMIMEKNEKLLVRKGTLTYLAGVYYFGVNYEIWQDRQKYEQGIYGEYLDDGQHLVYCTAYSGVDDKEMMELFVTLLQDYNLASVKLDDEEERK